ncbi:MAG: hypothetical protein AAF721_07655 [Myxococcota bacterium]
MKGRVRRGGVALGVLLFGCSSGRCTEPAAPTDPPATADDQAAEAKGEALPGGVELGELPEADRPATPPRWAVPECPLTYEFDMTVSSEVLTPAKARTGHAEIARMLAAAELHAVGEDRVELRSTLSTGSMTALSTTKLPVVGPGAYAATRLRLDGGQWQEHDGITEQWSAFGSFPGWVAFWPALPAGPEIGAEATWAFRLHAGVDALTTEATRGSKSLPDGFVAPEADPVERRATVALAGWNRVAATPAARYEATWSTDDRADGGLRSTGVFEGSYLVLGNGRLLHASVRGDVDSVAEGLPEEMRVRVSMTAEARLVAACDGVVLAGFDIATQGAGAPPEVVLAFAKAVGADDASAMVDTFAPALVNAHGRAPIERALADHFTEFGAESLGDVRKAILRTGEGPEVSVELQDTRRTGAGSPAGITRLVVEPIDGVEVITSVELTRHVADAGWQRLDINTHRLDAGQR